MVRYRKTWWGLTSLLIWDQSAFGRCLPYTLLAFVECALLHFYIGDWDMVEEVREGWLHPYPFQAFAAIVGFFIVFRTNLAYQRYWEGRTALQKLTSKLTDAAVLGVTLDAKNEKCIMLDDKVVICQDPEKHKQFVNKYIHLISLLHAVALATLRMDYSVQNLVAHDSEAVLKRQKDGLTASQDADETSDEAPSPVQESRSGLQDVDSGMETSVGVNLGASSSMHKPLVSSRRRKKGPQVSQVFRSASGRTAKESRFDTLFGYKVPKKFKRSCKILWHFMDDVASNFYLRDSMSYELRQHRRSKLPVINHLTQQEGDFLGGGATDQIQWGRSALVEVDENSKLRGIWDPKLQVQLPAPMERVHAIQTWIYELLFERMNEGGVGTDKDSSTRARLQAFLSDAMLAYEQCKKVTETQFPFPWYQATTFIILMFTITFPWMAWVYIEHAPTSIMTAAMAVQLLTLMNEVANDVEDPFTHDASIQFRPLQFRFNERLITIQGTRRPWGFADRDNPEPCPLQGSSAYRAHRPYRPPGASVDGTSGHSVPHVATMELARKSKNFLALFQPFRKSNQNSQCHEVTSPASDFIAPENSGSVTGFSLDEGFCHRTDDPAPGLQPGGGPHESAMHAHHAHASPQHPFSARRGSGHASSSSSGTVSEPSKMSAGLAQQHSAGPPNFEKHSGQKLCAQSGAKINTGLAENKRPVILSFPPLQEQNPEAQGAANAAAHKFENLPPVNVSNNPMYQDDYVMPTQVAAAASGTSVSAHPLSNSLQSSADSTIPQGENEYSRASVMMEASEPPIGDCTTPGMGFGLAALTHETAAGGRETITQVSSAAHQRQASEVKDWMKPYKPTGAHAMKQHRTATERRDAWKRGETWKGAEAEDTSLSNSEDSLQQRRAATVSAWNMGHSSSGNSFMNMEDSGGSPHTPILALAPPAMHGQHAQLTQGNLDTLTRANAQRVAAATAAMHKAGPSAPGVSPKLMTPSPIWRGDSASTESLNRAGSHNSHQNRFQANVAASAEQASTSRHPMLQPNASHGAPASPIVQHSFPQHAQHAKHGSQQPHSHQHQQQQQQQQPPQQQHQQHQQQQAPQFSAQHVSEAAPVNRPGNRASVKGPTSESCEASQAPLYGGSYTAKQRFKYPRRPKPPKPVSIQHHVQPTQLGQESENARAYVLRQQSSGSENPASARESRGSNSFASSARGSRSKRGKQQLSDGEPVGESSCKGDLESGYKDGYKGDYKGETAIVQPYINWDTNGQEDLNMSHSDTGPMRECWGAAETFQNLTSTATCNLPIVSTGDLTTISDPNENVLSDRDVFELWRRSGDHLSCIEMDVSREDELPSYNALSGEITFRLLRESDNGGMCE